MKYRFFVKPQNLIIRIKLKGKDQHDLRRFMGLTDVSFHRLICRKREVKGEETKAVMRFLPGIRWDEIFEIKEESATSA